MDPSQINLDDPASFLNGFTLNPTALPPATAEPEAQPAAATTALTIWQPPHELPQQHALYITLDKHITQATVIAAAEGIYGPGSLTHIAPAPLLPPAAPPLQPDRYDGENAHEGDCDEGLDPRAERAEANTGMLDLPAVIEFHRLRLLNEALERREAKARSPIGAGLLQTPEMLKRYVSPFFFVVDMEDWEHDGVWVVDVSAVEEHERQAAELEDGGPGGWSSDVMIRRFYPDAQLGGREEEDRAAEAGDRNGRRRRSTSD